MKKNEITTNWMRVGSAGAEKGTLLPIFGFVSRQRVLSRYRVLQMLCCDKAFRVPTWSSGQVHDRHQAHGAKLTTVFLRPQQKDLGCYGALFMDTVHGHYS